MTYLQALSICFKKSFVWEGRAARNEYWWFQLGAYISLILAYWIGDAVGTVIIYILVAIVFFFPSLAVLIRRLHDTDRSGWWYWILILPLIGAIVLLIFTLLSSDEGDNKYGPNPHGSVAPPPPAV